MLKSRTLLLAILASSTCLFTAVDALPAQAASCSGFSCAGYDPLSRNCPVSSTTVTYGKYATVWNRYSYACRANWGRAQLTPAGVVGNYQWILKTTTIDSRGYSETTCVPPYADNNKGVLAETCYGTIHVGTAGYDQVWYTDMVDGTNQTSANVYIYDPNAWPYVAIAQYTARQ